MGFGIFIFCCVLLTSNVMNVFCWFMLQFIILSWHIFLNTHWCKPELKKHKVCQRAKNKKMQTLKKKKTFIRTWRWNFVQYYCLSSQLTANSICSTLPLLSWNRYQTLKFVWTENKSAYYTSRANYSKRSQSLVIRITSLFFPPLDKNKITISGPFVFPSRFFASFLLLWSDGDD